jgi:hypothetical protein
MSGLQTVQRSGGREFDRVHTPVEPFRSLYYVKINYVRYLKGLRNLQKTL